MLQPCGFRTQVVFCWSFCPFFVDCGAVHPAMEPILASPIESVRNLSRTPSFDNSCGHSGAATPLPVHAISLPIGHRLHFRFMQSNVVPGSAHTFPRNQKPSRRCRLVQHLFIICAIPLCKSCQLCPSVCHRLCRSHWMLQRTAKGEQGWGTYHWGM